MSGINRLTYYFYAHVEETEEKIRLTTNFPFLVDDQLLINRPVERTDVVSATGSFDANPLISDIENIIKVSNYGNYNERNWFIGLSVNRVVIYDGLFKKPEGISSIFFNGGGQTEGIVEINKNSFNTEFGILDNLEIIVISAQTWSPWLYYGYDYGEGLGQARAFLLRNIENGSWRVPTNMGGIFSSLVPAQAIQMRHFVNVDLSALSVPLILPFPSAFFIGTLGSASSSNNVFHTADVIDGNGQLKLRSSVKFNISSQSLSGNLAGTSFNLATVVRADAYRTLNSRKLEYTGVTYSEKKILQNTKYNLCFEKNKKYKDIYISIANSIGLIVDKFIDKTDSSGVKFIFTGYDSSNVENIIQETNDLVSAAETLRSTFENDNFYTIDPIEEELQEGSLGWNNDNLSLVINSTKNLALSDSDSKYSIAIFSGMNLTNEDIQASVESLGSLAEISNVIGVFLKHNSFIINEEIFTQRKERGVQIFGSSYLGIQEGSFAGFQLINILFKLIGGNLNSENDLFEISSKEFELSDGNKITLSGIDPDILIKQSQDTVSEVVGASSQDFDGDGSITLIDRIYSLYQNFDRNNQLISDRFYGFFSDFGAEMRYWRRVCPHGQNFKLTGRISSATADIAGNYMLKIVPVWKDSDGNWYEPSSTSIDVYVENSVRSNVSYTTISDSILEFQGRLFYPSYITKLKISPVISLSDIDEISAWYRLSRSAATRFVSEAQAGWKDKPVLFCRSNLGEVDPSVETVGLISVPPLFSGVQNQFESQYTPSFFKISQFVEYVGDHVYNIDFAERDSVLVNTGTPPAVIFTTTGQLPETAGGTGTQTVPISFYEIEFNVEVSGNTDDFYKYEVDVLFKPSGEDEFVQFYKFYSAVCFDVPQEEPPYRGKVKFIASDPLRFFCRPAPEEFITDDFLNGRLFHIDMPYRQIENFRYSFNFDREQWDAKLYVNDRRVSALVIDNQASFGNFGAEFSQINPFTGQIIFKDRVDTSKNSVSIVFTHKRELKIGSQLAVQVVSGPSGGVTISDVSVNFFSSPSIERVEGEYSSTLYGDNYHLICPTQGFVSLTGSSWFFSQEEGTSDAANFSPGSLSVVGDLNSPFLYFDAFAEPSDIANKTIKMGNENKDFPIIDIPHTTIAVNSSGAPFTEVRTVGYTPPEQDAQAKIDSVFDKNMRKFSVIYNINNILNMKYSFTKFEDRDTDNTVYDFVNKSLRRNIPIYTGPLSLEEKSISGDGIFSIEEANRTAVGLEIISNRLASENLEEDNGIYFLQASSGSGFSSFGYVDGNGIKHTLLIPVYNKASRDARGYIQLPYSQGTTQLKLQQKAGTNVGDIKNVNVQYIDNDKFVNGISGDIELFKTGDYAIFYYSTPDSNIGVNQVVAVMSSKDGQYWKRPGVEDLNSADSFKPIPILSNYSHPLVLSNEANDMLFLFVFGNLDNSVNLVHITRSMFMKLVKGSDDEEYSSSNEQGTGDPSVKEPENSRSNIMSNPDKKSWAEYFGGSGNHILPITFNSSAIFSAALSERGTIYFISKSIDNELRLKINFSEGGTEYSSGGWFDIGIDFFHEDGYLSKTLLNSQIYAITLSYDKGMEGLHLFISTTDKLFVFRVPGALVREKNTGAANIDERINEFYQELVNQKKPVLIVGTTQGLSEDNTDLNGIALEEQFIPQQVSVNWTEDGQSWLFFLGESGNLRCVTSTSDGKTWKINSNV